MKILLAVTLVCLPLLVVDAADPVGSAGANPPIEQPAQAAKPQRPLITTELGGREIQFFQLANEAGLRQFALATLAKGRGLSDQLQAVATALLVTQAEENKQVARLAALKGVNLVPLRKDPATELSELAGAKFEKAWIERLVAANQMAVDAYEIGAKAQDPEIRSFAEKLLPLETSKLQVANRLAGNSTQVKPEVIEPIIEPAAPVKPPGAAPVENAAPASTPKPAATPKSLSTPKPSTSKASPKPATSKPTPKATASTSPKKKSSARKTTPPAVEPASMGLVQWLRERRGTNSATASQPPPIASGPRSVLKPFLLSPAPTGAQASR